MAVGWGSKTSATQLTSITTEQFFDETPQLAANQLAHCEVEANFPVTPTDNLVVAIYATLDAAAENWDDTAVHEFEIDNGDDPNKVAFVIEDLYKFRVGVRRSGSTDIITSADFNYRLATLS